MSSQKDLVSNSRRFFTRRESRRQSKSPCGSLWRQAVSRRSQSRSKTPSQLNKKIHKIHKVDPQVRHRLSRRRKAQVKRPSAPHNTNQFLIDANNLCEEPTNIYPEQDRFSFDFQNHSMAGSMMDFMARFAQMHGQSTEASNCSEKSTVVPLESVGETNMDLGNESFGFSQGIQEISSLMNQETCQEERVSDLVNSNTSRLGSDNPVNIAVRNDQGQDSYSHYLKQAENGENLQDLIQQLVKVINQKDEEIHALKARLSL